MLSSTKFDNYSFCLDYLNAKKITGRIQKILNFNLKTKVISLGIGQYICLLHKPLNNSQNLQPRYFSNFLLQSKSMTFILFSIVDLNIKSKRKYVRSFNAKNHTSFIEINSD